MGTKLQQINDLACYAGKGLETKMASKSALYTAILVVGLAAAGCAGTTDPQAADLGPNALGPNGQAAAAAPAVYALNDEERALDCKKLTGRMQVRILQARDYEVRNQTSAASQALQKAVVMAGSNATQGLNPSADHAKDRAQIEAYNQRLAELKCKTFNLDDELRPKAVTSTPTAVAKSKDGKTAPPAPDDARSNVTIPIDKVGSKPVAKPQ